jgi:hypothetical protein
MQISSHIMINNRMFEETFSSDFVELSSSHSATGELKILKESRLY